MAQATYFNESGSEDEGEVSRDNGGKECPIEEVLDAATATEEPASKKKGRRGQKSQAARGPTGLPAYRGTGFEEYFADPPMTPDEAAQEKNEIYDEDLCFEERIENCINRFRGRRRLQPENCRYFNEYLFLGGIDTSPAQFARRDPKELKELTPTERRQVLAHDVAKSQNERYYNGDTDQWVVDFTGVAAGFLSNPLLELTDMEPAKVDKAVGVVENFLRYVLQHDVCPEHEGDVRNALQLCANARSEWASVHLLQRMLPGSFNSSAYYSFCVDDDDVADDTLDSERVSFLSSLALLEDDTIFQRHSSGEHKVARSFVCTVEVVDIHRPEAHIVKRFESLHIDDSSLGLSAIGSATFVPTVIETDFVEPPMPRPFPEDKMTLYFDDAHLALMKPGTKLKLNVCELDTGFRFVKLVGPVYPSFYTFLPQEMMKFFKPPRDNERPAPSIHTLNRDPEEEAIDE